MLTLEEQFKKLGFGSEDIEIERSDTQQVLESITAKGTQIKEKSGKASKFVFLYPMQYERAEQLMETIMLINRQELSTGEYKTKLLSECNVINVYKESPVEMLIYGSKGIKSKDYKLVILDVLRTIRAQDKRFISSYQHILTNWTWDDCLELVIQSVIDLEIKEVAEMVYTIFETKDNLRTLAAQALIDINATEYFNSMINYLAIRSNEQAEEKAQCIEIMKYLGRKHPLGSQYIFDAYVRENYCTASLNLMIAGIRLHITSDILKTIEHIVTDANTHKYVYYKMMRILERSSSKPVVQETLERLKKKVGQNKPNFYMNDSEALINIAINTTLPVKDRMDAVLYLANLDDPRIDGLLEHFKRESDLMCIVAASACVERGREDNLKLLFNYILKDDTDCSPDYIKEAISQIRRLRSISGPNSQKIQSTLELLIKTLLQPGKLKSLKVELRLIELYSKGIPSENLAEIFLEKLKSTSTVEVQQMLLKFFEQHRGRFSADLQERSLAEVIRLTKVASIDTFAMKVLETLTKGKNKELVIG